MPHASSWLRLKPLGSSLFLSQFLSPLFWCITSTTPAVPLALGWENRCCFVSVTAFCNCTWCWALFLWFVSISRCAFGVLQVVLYKGSFPEDGRMCTFPLRKRGLWQHPGEFPVSRMSQTSWCSVDNWSVGEGPPWRSVGSVWWEEVRTIVSLFGIAAECWARIYLHHMGHPLSLEIDWFPLQLTGVAVSRLHQMFIAESLVVTASTCLVYACVSLNSCVNVFMWI